MRIGELAKQTGVSRDTIRLYERMGLVKGVTRPHEFNNYKEYADENVERIRLILLMKKFGMTLKECANILTKIEENSFDLEYQKAFVAQKIKEIEDKIEELTSLKEILSGYLDAYCNELSS